MLKSEKNKKDEVINQVETVSQNKLSKFKQIKNYPQNNVS